jgi:hypothetical protein
MAGPLNFTTTTSARTRCAERFLRDPLLLSLFEEKGGIPEDLQAMITEGNLAESYNRAQSAAGAAASAASVEVTRKFQAVQEEYTTAMGALYAVRRELVRDNADPGILLAVDTIIANEAQLNVTTKEQDGAKKRKSSASRSQAAVRNEIDKDVAALIDLTATHELLARRRITKERLEKLLAEARALSGKLADRSTTKGAGIKATQEEREAVKRQSEVWAATYRILAAVGSNDPSVASLLKEASRKRQ